MKLIYTIEEHQRNSDLLDELKNIQALPPMSRCILKLEGRFTENRSTFNTVMRNEQETDDWLIVRKTMFHDAMVRVTDEYCTYLKKELGISE